MNHELVTGFAEWASVNWGYVAAVAALACFVLGLIAGMMLPPFTGRESRGSRRSASELYVGNLAYELTEKELRKAFEPYGRVLSTRIISSKSSGASKGYGFVQMSDPAEAKAAIESLNSQKVHGRRLIVSEARSQAKNL
jgi:RNA recognition motif-containing protein